MTQSLGSPAPSVLVIGAGAAGTMAAIHAAMHGADVTLLERTADGGRKILISGGGRCNVLPMQLDESRFETDSSRNTLRRLLRAWPLAEQRRFFEVDVGIPLAEEPALRKVFPASHKARDVRDGLLALAARHGVRLRFNARVLDVVPVGSAEAPMWRVTLEDGGALEAERLVLATGGLSVPATGSDGFGLRIARSLGHEIHAPYAALTPLTCEPSPYTELAGISLPVTLSAQAGARRATATGGFLFTHRGYSGPAALDVSHVAVRAQQDGGDGAQLRVQWTPHDEAAWTRALQPQGNRTVGSVVRGALPDRLAQVLLAMAQVDADERHRLLDTLVRGTLPTSGDEGYKKAEVTGGGVDLGEVNPRTMESRRHAGLFLCGELLDAFGPIGGYNFYWAWATGRAAGVGAAERRSE
ncbi:MAG: aminoacetone oxidase family FAD-binding enzyme [Gemmatimonadaceae bacterium]|nr:aminoacetone oxidase family FAD-binding enzyme [Gemmatimonadaceae bacterium]